MRRPRGAAAISLLMAVIALVYIYPLILVAINSLKTFAQIMENVMAFPSQPRWENFANAFTLMRYPNLFLNTLIVTCMGTAGVVLLASLPGSSFPARRPASAGSSSSCAWRP